MPFGFHWFEGGLNLKVHGGIEKMKGDMAGGAAVLGAAEALSQIRPEGIKVDSHEPSQHSLALSECQAFYCRLVYWGAQ